MSRLDAHQPVSVQPGTYDEVYTFANHWHKSLCGSFTPCYRATFACCCYPCYIAKLADRMDEHCATVWFNPCSLMALRTKIRTAFHIRGSLMGDCCATCCCTCICAAMQMERELDRQHIPSTPEK